MNNHRTKNQEIIITISPEGNDRGMGMEEPIATLERAMEIVKNLKNDGMRENHIYIQLREGTYWLEKPLEITEKESAPITFKPYPGEKVQICSGKKVNQWIEDEINGVKAWRTDLEEVQKGDIYYKQLFINGERRTRARLPKEGFYRIESVPNIDFSAGLTDRSNGFVYRDGDIKKWSHLEDIEVVLLHYWIEERFPIISVDEEERLVESNRLSMFSLKEAFCDQYAKYYVENIQEALLDPGEWYLERESGRLYYIPMTGEEMGATQGILPTIEELVHIEGNPQTHEFVEYIKFQDIEFSYTDWNQPETRKRRLEGKAIEFAGCPQAAVDMSAAVYVKGARHCIFKNCTFSHLGAHGIKVMEGCQGIQIIGNEFFDLGAGGIILNGSDAKGEVQERNHHQRITDNHIHDAGVVHPSGVGINCMHSSDNVISHNHIHHLYYTGINSGWVWGYEPSITKNNKIEYNHIHDLGQGVLSDMGGVYTLGVQPGTEIRNNLIHDINSAHYGAWGIYMDEGSSHIVIEKNICYRTKCNGFNQHYGRENILRNNIFAFGGNGLISLGRAENHLAFSAQQNIFIQEKDKPIYLGGYNGQLEKRNFYSNLNLLWFIGGSSIVGMNRKSTDLENKFGKTEFTLEGLKKLGYDLHSILEDPCFEDIDGLDFRLKETSPAFSLGFESICMDEVGPRSKNLSPQ